jgi:poly(A) polymerase Pap1
MDLTCIAGAKNLDISWPIQDFRRLCTEWEAYDKDVHSIQIKHVREYVRILPHLLPDADQKQSFSAR